MPITPCRYAPKRLVGPLLVLLLIASVQAQNVSVTDYSVPVSRANNLRIDGLSFNFVTEGDSILVESGNAGLVFKKFYSSLPFAYSFDFVGSASYLRDQTTGKRSGNFSTDFDMKVQKYFSRRYKFFYSASPSILYRRDFDRPEIDITLGLGYGRFINATPLRKAVRIEEFLLKEGVVSKNLPPKTMIELGHLIEKESEYRDLYGGSYQNYWYEDMSNEINKTGLVLGNRGNLGPIGILRMREVLTQERINDRFFGWDINIGVQYQVLTRQDSIARKSPAMAVNLRYSRPVSWSTQINTDLKVDTPFNDNFGHDYQVTQRVDFIYEISNKVAFAVLNTLRMDKKRNIDAKFSMVSNASLTFFVENKISMTISEQVSKIEGQPFRQSFNVALNYRIF